MIGSIRGQIIAHDSDKVLVEVGGAVAPSTGNTGTGNTATGGAGAAQGGGIGYWVHVTPQTLATLMSAENMPNSKNGSAPNNGSSSGTSNLSFPVLFHTEHIVREDAQLLYGFLTQEERMCFSTLIAISGIGPQLALAVLATHSPHDLQTLLLDGDIDSLCLVSGIGPKKARQLLPILKDRFAVADFQPAEISAASSSRAEARQALSELGYSAEEVQAALADVSSATDADTETLVKDALLLLSK